MCDPHQLNEILTTTEVGNLLSVSNHKVYALAKAGKLPGRRIGERPFRFHRNGILKIVGVSDPNIKSDFPDVLTMAELAVFLRINFQTLYRLQSKNVLDLPVVINSPIRFSRRGVLQWLCSNESI
jgi:excisionase family DNA binding protein